METEEWNEKLRDFVQLRRQNRSIPTIDDLDDFDDSRRRVSGGILLQFLEFIQTDEPYRHFPNIGGDSISDRVFVFVSGAPGFVAARHIIDRDSDRAIYLLKEEWYDWLQRSDTPHDRDFEHHYECWSVWHQQLDPGWRIDPDSYDGQLWVNQEGFALADRAGRGAQHLWLREDGDFDKIEEEIDSWVSSPPE